MGSTLTNGIYLPAEGERNCYTGLAANWTALDSLIGGYNVHIGNATIHVTAEDKAAWNGKADASALTAHTGDTTIHVTAADKEAWNGKQDALSQTQLDAVNSGIDSTKVQQIATNTSDISSLQSDKANNSDVVHKSGNETVGGVKTFTDSIQFKSNVAEYGVTSGNIQFYLMDKNSVGLSKINQGVYTSGVSYITLQLYGRDSNNQTVTNTITYQYASNLDKTYLRPTDNSVWLGSTDNRWGKIYGIQYYYGDDNVEFSTKFVTTDTAQTISGSKTFSSNVNVYNSDSAASTPNLTLRSSKSAIGTSDTDVQTIYFSDKNGTSLASVKAQNFTLNGATYLQSTVNTKDTNNQVITASASLYILNNGRKVFRPEVDNDILLGYTGNRWKDVNTYLVNGVEPSSLSLPSGNASNVIDISSYITDLSGAVNSYTVPANGWISISVIGTAIDIVSSSWSDSRLRPSAGNVRMLYPVIKNETVGISVSGTTLAYARFIPCQGNV